MPYQTSKLRLGAAYYPEHWPKERWPGDIQLMKKAGFTVVRMGEFAWSTFEPVEGEFHFEWLDLAIEMLAENGMASVLGTPTAAPPAWLTQSYPDSLAVDEQGSRLEHGNRCHSCINSVDYHRHTQEIVNAMGEYFGANPHVIGWQLDNEYNRVCYCDHCRNRFHDYLAEKYQTLENLNRRWTTAYWSQTYSSWNQIPLPKGEHNPGLMLEFQHFVTQSYCNFQKLQLNTLRPHLHEDVWVTHNFMGWFGGFDHYQLADDLDVVAWDWYITNHHNNYLENGAAHDLIRGFKRQNYWLMETQPGHIHWSPTVNNILHKGETRAMAWHAIGHGADAMLYWQWRAACGGQEQYHGTLVDQSGQPRPIYEEIKRLGDDISRTCDLFRDTKPESKVAILNDYDSRWMIQWQPHHKDFNYINHLISYYKPFAARNIPVDIISADDSFAGYRIVVAPAMMMLTHDRAKKLEAFVKCGGSLMLTARCGMKDEYNALLPLRQPGFLSELAGVEVEEFYALDEKVPLKGNWFSGSATIWAERLKIIGENTQVIATYSASNGWLDDQTGITVNVDSKAAGMVYYVGAYLDESSQDMLVGRILQTSMIRPLMDLPDGVEICRRSASNGLQVGIIINHARQEQLVNLPFPIQDHINDEKLQGEIVLMPFDVIVFTRAHGEPTP